MKRMILLAALFASSAAAIAQAPDTLHVKKVEDGGAAAEAGIEEGDVIIGIDGKKVGKLAELNEVLAGKRPGDKAKVTFLHKKEKKEKVVTLKNTQGSTDVVKTADLDVLGANFKEISDAQKKQLEISYGLEITKINNGVMKDAGLAKGFIIQKINDTPVKTLDDLQKVVKDASTSKEPVLYIQGLWPTGKKKYFAVDLSKN